MSALDHDGNLADGHAYHGLDSMLPGLSSQLSFIWETCEMTSVHDMESQFRESFARLIGSPTVAGVRAAVVCPTASNSIDIVGALLAERNVSALMLEPTFDNLALLLRRRGVPLASVCEDEFHQLASGTTVLAERLRESGCGALFIVEPNNPTGSTLDRGEFEELAHACASTGTILILDRSFRLFVSYRYDDHLILDRSDCSYIIIEDTGKVWPTHDLKASLLYSSDDLAGHLRQLYAELYLCHSRFALALLRRCIEATNARGLAEAVHDPVRSRRELLRSSLRDTPVQVAEGSNESWLPVEWLDCSSLQVSDVEICGELSARGVRVLPGTNFFRNSGYTKSSARFSRSYIRGRDDEALASLCSCRRKIGTYSPSDGLTNASGRTHGKRLHRSPFRDPAGRRTGRRAPRKSIDVERLGEILSEARYYVLGGEERLTADALTSCRNMKAIVFLGTGASTFIDLDAAHIAGISVLTTPGIISESVAEHAVSLILAARRGLLAYNDAVKRGGGGRVKAGDLRNARIGIVGLGQVGRHVARLLRPFGCTVSYAVPCQRQPQKRN